MGVCVNLTDLLPAAVLRKKSFFATVCIFDL